MVAFEAVASESGALTLAVLAQPGSTAGSKQAKLQLVPLEKWGD